MPRFSFVVTSHANTMPPRDFHKEVVHKEAEAENFARGMAVQHVLQKYRREKRRVASAELVRRPTRLSRVGKAAAATPPAQPQTPLPQPTPLISGLSLPGLMGTSRSTVAQAAISVASPLHTTCPSLFDCVTIPITIHYGDSESSSSSGQSSSELSSDSENEDAENTTPPDERPVVSLNPDNGILSRLAHLLGGSAASTRPNTPSDAQESLDAFLYDTSSKPPQDSHILKKRPI